MQKHKDMLDGCIMHDKDFYFDYFGFKTLERSYLLKLGKKVCMSIRPPICQIIHRMTSLMVY